MGSRGRNSSDTRQSALLRSLPVPTIRDYQDSDEQSWLRCRALSFLGSSYFDDVKADRTRFDGEAVRLVAVRPRPERMTTAGPDEVVGLIDVEFWQEDDVPVATVDTIAVHPDHQREGIAATLLATALDALHGRGIRWIDAWTREDPGPNAWYAAQGFVVDSAYLHVYKDSGESDEGYAAPHGLGAPVKALFHGPDEDPAVWRARFARVHQCRRYLRRLDATSWPEDPRVALTYDVECAGRWDDDYYVALAERLGARRVTDLGAGTGALTIDLAARGVVATALEPTRVPRLRRRAPGRRWRPRRDGGPCSAVLHDRRGVGRGAAAHAPAPVRRRPPGL